MWKPNLITAKKAELELRYYQSVVIDVTQIYFDDGLFCNGVELLRIYDGSVQFIVCSHCGGTDCMAGNYLSIRRCGNFVVLIPSFLEMEEGDWEATHYWPPYKVEKNGAIYLTKEQYSELKAFIPKLKAYRDLDFITRHEVALLVQWEAPYKALGEYPLEIELNQDLYLTTESPLEEGIIKELYMVINDFLASKAIANCIESSEVNSAIFLDTIDFLQWNPITEIEGKFHLRLDPIFVFRT